MDKELVQRLHADINAAVDKILEDYGLSIETLKAKYDDASVTFTLKVISNSATDQQANFARYAASFGVNRNLFNKRVKYRDEYVRIIGLEPRRSEFPVLVEDNEGKKFLLRLSFIKSKEQEILNDPINF